LGTHARDELGMTQALAANPVQAAASSATSFAVGAAIPLAAAWLSRGSAALAVIAGTSLAALVVLGVVAARVGGAPVLAGAWRVAFWGTLAMAVTAAAGRFFGAAG
jgi:vacuolar iron transporter family protein